MENMKSIINKHDKRVTATNPPCPRNKHATVRAKTNAHWTTISSPTTLYNNAQVTASEDVIGKCYIGLTEGTFKQGFAQHKLCFRNRKYVNSTELSKNIWNLQDNNKYYDIQRSIIAKVRPYNNISRKCDHL